MARHTPVCRLATLKDIPAIVDLLTGFHERSPMSHIKVRPERVRNTLQQCINQREHRVWVAQTDEEPVVGVMVGITNPIWFSDKKQATDLVFAVKEPHTGLGYYLIRRFLAWARNAKGVEEIILSTTFGDNESLDAVYRKLGFTPIGKVYYQELSRCPA